MPLGFNPPHPEGMAHSSPTFQRWVREFKGAQVPKGRMKPCASRQPSLRDLSDCGGGFPTLKRWAIIGYPSGTRTWPALAYLVGASPGGIGSPFCRFTEPPAPCASLGAELRARGPANRQTGGLPHCVNEY